MLNISWRMNAEPLVSRGVFACSDAVVDYRDRQFVNGVTHCAARVVGVTSHATFAHLTVNPLVPRPRAKHG